MKTQIKMALAFVLRRIYGVRGAIKPPLGPYNTPLRKARHRWWLVVNKLYKWSGLPEEWHRKVGRGGLCEYQSEDGKPCCRFGDFYLKSTGCNLCMDHMIDEIIDQRIRATGFKIG